MNISPAHYLEGVTRQIIPGGNPMPIRRALVIHCTGGATGQSSINYWRTPDADGASAHIVIERHGAIIQCRAFDRTCGHAGKSKWVDPKTGKLYTGMNSCTIGIELANAGSDDAALRWARKQPGFAFIKASHRNGGPVVEWEAYPVAQISALTEVATALVHRYQLDDITGHDCIAPHRKDDPGPAFDPHMAALRKALGFPGFPAVHR